MMNINKLFILFWLVFGGGVHASQQADTGVQLVDIVVPRPHNPAFAEPGGTFDVEVRALSGLSATGWEATLRNDLATWRCDVKQVEQAAVFLGTEQGWVLTIRAPKEISPELMELVLTHESGVSGVSSRSVSIVPDFEQDFYIVHQSDQHLTLRDAVEPGGKASKKWGNGSMEALTWGGPILNLINPRFVLQTGDNMQIYNEPDSWCGLEEGIRRMERFIEGLSNYQVPTVATTGNHDIGYTNYVEIDRWRNAYRKHMGQRVFSFRMGSFYVLASEWTDTTFTRKLTEDYRKTWKDPTIAFRLVATHFYDGLQAPTTIATEDYPCDLTLVGHIHRTRILQEEPYPVLAVGAAQQHQRAAFFDFRRTETGWRRTRPDSHAEGTNVHQLIGDWGKPTVSIRFEHANDGSTSSNTAVITNKLPYRFYDGRVRFLMEKGDYQVVGGDILAMYDVEGHNQTAVLVKVDLAESSDTNLAVLKKTVN